MSKQTFVIVGASLAGAKAAAELRDRGFDGEIVLVGSEPDRPYERPPLSKTYLTGASQREELFVHQSGFYEEHNIELITGRMATEIDLDANRIVLEDDRHISFDKLLLTTGAEPRRLSVPGADLDGIMYLRTLADCEALRERLASRGRLTVVGAGWIGSEVAASAREQGIEVSLIDPLELPSERIFGPEIASFYRDLHAQHGVNLLLGDGITAFEGDQAVTAARTSSGRLLECDMVVVGVGVLPCTQLAARAGLETDNGIVVDEKLQTSNPRVFAAGDVANAWHPTYGRRIRMEHWANALNQGPAAARTMIGEPVSYDQLPYFFSDQYDVGMEFSGNATGCEEVVIRGSREAGEFIAFWLKDGRVNAGMNVNIWDVNESVQSLIRSQRMVNRAALADPDTPLESIVHDPV